MNSIKKKLSYYLAFTISVLLVLILLATDITVDGWVNSEFDRAMVNKIGLLETLVVQNEKEIDFEFSGEFMPEFEGRDNPEYFQLWQGDKVFERSDTLDFFEIKDLPRLTLELNEHQFRNILLPDGREGRVLYTKILPQIDSDLRKILGEQKTKFFQTQQPIEFAYALSKKELNYILWLVDIVFVVTSFLTVLTINIIVSIVVDKNFKPIEDFNKELSRISLNSDKIEVSTSNLPIELIPIANGVNQFVRENHDLYKREQRITSDIAHELKTPISELLSLSEVAIKFPHAKQITDTLASDVQQISTRLKNIVNGILILEKSTSISTLEEFDINLINLLEDILTRENTNNQKVIFEINCINPILQTNITALDSILSNLINNALFYSPDDSTITFKISNVNGKKTKIQISNFCASDYCEGDLDLFFEPLWQKDSSRTSTQRYGLGLSIVKSYCEKLGFSIKVSVDLDKIITFTIIT